MLDVPHLALRADDRPVDVTHQIKEAFIFQRCRYLVLRWERLLPYGVQPVVERL